MAWCAIAPMLGRLDRYPARRACLRDVFGQRFVGDEAVVAFDAKPRWSAEGEKLGKAHIAKLGETVPYVAKTEKGIGVCRVILADEPRSIRIRGK